MSEDLLSLKWNNHHPTFLYLLSSLHTKGTFSDVSLACNGKIYPAHKFVLSTCSEYFEEIFNSTDCKQPVIVLKDIEPVDLESLLSYMYLGEVNVLQNRITDLIKAADCLHIKGLSAPDDTPENLNNIVCYSNNNSKHNKPFHINLKNKNIDSKPNPQINNQNDSSLQNQSKLSKCNEPIKDQGSQVNNNLTNKSTSQPQFNNNLTNKSRSQPQFNNNVTNKSRSQYHDTTSTSQLPHDEELSNSQKDSLDIKCEPSNMDLDEPLPSSMLQNKSSMNYISNEVDDNTLSSDQLNNIKTCDNNNFDHQSEVNNQDEHFHLIVPNYPLREFEGVGDTSTSHGIGGNSEDEQLAMIEDAQLLPQMESNVLTSGDWSPTQVNLDQDYGELNTKCKTDFLVPFSNLHNNSFQSRGSIGRNQQNESMHDSGEYFKCSICNFRTVTRGSLKRHLQRHTGEKPFKCPFCIYKAAQKHHLDHHIRTHTGEKPFQCPYCPFQSSIKSNLRRHILIHKTQVQNSLSL